MLPGNCLSKSPRLTWSCDSEILKRFLILKSSDRDEESGKHFWRSNSISIAQLFLWQWMPRRGKEGEERLTENKLKKTRINSKTSIKFDFVSNTHLYSDKMYYDHFGEKSMKWTNFFHHRKKCIFHPEYCKLECVRILCGNLGLETRVSLSSL